MSNYYNLDRIVQEHFNSQYVIPTDKNTIRYDVRQLDKYCKEQNKSPKNLHRMS